MLLIYEKSTGQIHGKFTGDQTIEAIYKNNADALERLAGIYVSEEDVPNGNINEFKVVNNIILKMTYEEIDSKEIKNSFLVKFEKLENELQMLGQQVVDLDLRLLKGGL